ncbi:MAG: methyltransferase domain-containing protein [Alphaproteobacteria bacterium]
MINVVRHSQNSSAAFDVVCCPFGVMFFSDKVRAFREALRVLRPGGAFVFSSWDRLETNVLADVVTEAPAAIFPLDPPAFLARTPYGYHDTEAMRKDAGCGLQEPRRSSTRDASSHAPAARDVAIAFVEGTRFWRETRAV